MVDLQRVEAGRAGRRVKEGRAARKAAGGRKGLSGTACEEGATQVTSSCEEGGSVNVWEAS